MATMNLSGVCRAKKLAASLLLSGVCFGITGFIDEIPFAESVSFPVAYAGVWEEEAVEKQDVMIQAAKEEYGCALAAAAVYDSEMNKILRCELEHMG